MGQPVMGNDGDMTKRLLQRKEILERRHQRQERQRKKVQVSQVVMVDRIFVRFLGTNIFNDVFTYLFRSETVTDYCENGV